MSRLNPSSNAFMPHMNQRYYVNVNQQMPFLNYPYGVPPNSFHLQQNNQIHHPHSNLQQPIGLNNIVGNLNNLNNVGGGISTASATTSNLNNINLTSNISSSSSSSSSSNISSSSSSSSSKDKDKEKEKEKEKEQNIPKTNTLYTTFDSKNLELASRYFSECSTKDYSYPKKKATSLAWNCDGTRLACGNADGTARVWNFENNSLTTIIPTGSGSSSSSSSSSSRSSSSSSSSNKEFEIKHDGSIEKLSWSPKNPDILATAGTDRFIRVWDVKKNSCIASINTNGENIDIRWYPDGSYMLSCTRDDHVSLIDVSTMKILKNYKFIGEELNEVTWDNQGKLMFMTNGAGNIEVYKFTPRSSTVKQEVVKHLKTLSGHTNIVYCLDFDPNGRYFAAGSADSIVSLWDLEDMMCIKTFTKLSFPCRSISFSFDGQFISSASEEPILDISHVESGQSVFSIECSGIAALKWHPKLPILAYAPEIGPNDKDTTIKIFGFHS